VCGVPTALGVIRVGAEDAGRWLRVGGKEAP